MERYYKKAKIYLNFTSFQKWKTDVTVTGLQPTVLSRYENVNITPRSLCLGKQPRYPPYRSLYRPATGLNGRGCNEISYPHWGSNFEPSILQRVAIPAPHILQVTKKEQEIVLNRR